MMLDAKIEAVLFWKAESIGLSELAKIFNASADEIKSALVALDKKFKDRGISLVQKDDEVALKTSPDVSSIIENLAKEELSRELGKAGLETLSIILYQGPIARRDIDYIRGVNSSFILRNLLIRGLAERIEDPKNVRSFLYRPTFELLSFMGISKIEDLPDYQSVREEIATFKSSEDSDSATANEV